MRLPIRHYALAKTVGSIRLIRIAELLLIAFKQSEFINHQLDRDYYLIGRIEGIILPDKYAQDAVIMMRISLTERKLVITCNLLRAVTSVLRTINRRKNNLGS